MLKETILDETVDPVVSDVWRASEAGELCEAYLCHVRLGHQPLPMQGRIRHLLDDGNVHEDDIVARLKNGGFDVLNTGDKQLYVHCVSGSININGHPDGILRNIPKDLQNVDWADENFSWDSAYHLLEITAPNNFAFKRYWDQHLRGVNWRKFVQTHLYLGSEELRDRMRCAVVIVKDKMTSALYEEGLTFDQAIVDQTVEKLKRVEDLVSRGQVAKMRCKDWHKFTCKFRHLCFADPTLELPDIASDTYLDGNMLDEAQLLNEALDSFVCGKELEDSGKGMVEEARAYFAEILEQYNVKGVFVAKSKIKWTDSTWSGIDTDTLELKYPTVYEEVHITKPTRFVTVGKVTKRDRVVFGDS